MNMFMDTSTLVASFVEDHPRHQASFTCLEKAGADDHRLYVSSHSLCEMYAVLTTLPVQPRISPQDAMQLIRRNIIAGGTIVELTLADYEETIQHMSDLGYTGGIVYDALILQAALKCDADELITLNPKDFNRLKVDESMLIVEP